MSDTTYTTTVDDCGCKWEVTGPGCRRLTGDNRCERHRREAVVRIDAEGAVDMMVDECGYQGTELRLWVDTAADYLSSMVVEP